MNYWKQIGPEWRTESVFQIREILRGEHIPFRMPFSDVFFANLFHRPDEDKRWGILVREKDWERVVALLAREELVSREMLAAMVHEHCAAEARRAGSVVSALPSR